MSRLSLHPWRRCRLLFALALYAWLSLAGAVWAHADCCAGMMGGGVAGTATMTHHADAPVSPHGDGVQADCACAHATVTLPELPASAASACLVATTWQTWPAAAPTFPDAPPLRPPQA